MDGPPVPRRSRPPDPLHLAGLDTGSDLKLTSGNGHLPSPPPGSRPPPAAPHMTGPAGHLEDDRPKPPASAPSSRPASYKPSPAGQEKNNNTTSASKKPVITVLGARPMSEVGFRDAPVNNSSSTGTSSAKPQPEINVISAKPISREQQDSKPSRPPAPTRPAGPPRPARPRSVVLESNSSTSEEPPFVADKPVPPKPAQRSGRPRSMVEPFSYTAASTGEITFDGFDAQNLGDKSGPRSPSRSSEQTADNNQLLIDFNGHGDAPGAPFTSANRGVPVLPITFNKSSKIPNQPHNVDQSAASHAAPRPKPAPSPRPAKKPVLNDVRQDEGISQNISSTGQSFDMHAHDSKVEFQSLLNNKLKTVGQKQPTSKEVSPTDDRPAFKSKPPPPVKPKPALLPKPLTKPKPAVKPKPSSPPKTSVSPPKEVSMNKISSAVSSSVFVEADKMTTWYDEPEKGKPAGSGPVRATYRPTIIRAPAKPPVSHTDYKGPVKGKAISTSNIAAEAESEAGSYRLPVNQDKPEADITVKTRSRPTVIRPKSMVLSSAVSMPNLAQTQDDLSLKLVSFDEPPKQPSPVSRNPPPGNAHPVPPAAPHDENDDFASWREPPKRPPPVKRDPPIEVQSVQAPVLTQGTNVPSKPAEISEKENPHKVLTEKNARDVLELSQVGRGEKQMTFSHMKQAASLSKVAAKNVKLTHIKKTVTVVHSASKLSDDPSDANAQKTSRAMQDLAKDMKGPSTGDILQAAKIGYKLSTEQQPQLSTSPGSTGTGRVETPHTSLTEQTAVVHRRGSDGEKKKRPPRPLSGPPPARPSAPPTSRPPARPSAPPSSQPPGRPAGPPGSKPSGRPDGQPPPKPSRLKTPDRPPDPPSLPSRPGPDHPLHHYMASVPHAVVLYDYDASQEDELTLRAGDTVELVRVVGEWLVGRQEGREGMFPATFVDIKVPPGSAQTDETFSPQENVPQKFVYEMTGPRCEARFDYEGGEEEDLMFVAGDIISLVEWVGDDWLRGELNGHKGIFPASFVEVIEAPPLPDVNNAPEKNDENVILTSKEYFGGQNELSFTAGAPVKLLGRVDSQWLYGDLYGAQGRFPADCIKDIPNDLPLMQDDLQPTQTQQTPSDPAPSHRDDSEKTSRGRCVATFPYSSGEAGDLSFNEGDVILVLDYVDDDWMRGSLNDREGIFPKAYVNVISDQDDEDLPPRPVMITRSVREKTPPAESVPAHTEMLSTGTAHDRDNKGTSDDRHITDNACTSLGTAIAVYDFPGESEGDLSFCVGDHIEITEVIDSDWMKGRKGYSEGMFPSAFVDFSQH